MRSYIYIKFVWTCAISPGFVEFDLILQVEKPIDFNINTCSTKKSIFIKLEKSQTIIYNASRQNSQQKLYPLQTKFSALERFVANDQPTDRVFKTCNWTKLKKKKEKRGTAETLPAGSSSFQGAVCVLLVGSDYYTFFRATNRIQETRIVALRYSWLFFTCSSNRDYFNDSLTVRNN